MSQEPVLAIYVIVGSLRAVSIDRLHSRLQSHGLPRHKFEIDWSQDVRRDIRQDLAMSKQLCGDFASEHWTIRMPLKESPITKPDTPLASLFRLTTL